MTLHSWAGQELGAGMTSWGVTNKLWMEECSRMVCFAQPSVCLHLTGSLIPASQELLGS